MGVTVRFDGGLLNNLEFKDPKIVRQYARKAQLGEIFEFNRASYGSDGVFRASPRTWFCYSHVIFSLLFFFGHIWHGSRTLFRDVLSGIDPVIEEQIEFGAFEKLGDSNTKR